MVISHAHQDREMSETWAGRQRRKEGIPVPDIAAAQGSAPLVARCIEEGQEPPASVPMPLMLCPRVDLAAVKCGTTLGMRNPTRIGTASFGALAGESCAREWILAAGLRGITGVVGCPLGVAQYRKLFQVEGQF
jgi:hypothetical protein